MTTYSDTPLEGVDLVVGPKGDMGKPTGKTGWCFDCDCMMLEVHWRHVDESEWICFSAMQDLGEGIWQIDPNLFG